MAVALPAQRLTFVRELISLAALALVVNVNQNRALAAPPTPINARFSVAWDGVPLADAVARLRQTTGSELWIDRRVDPSQPIHLTVNDAATDEIVAQLAASLNLGHAPLGQLHYLGPVETTTRLANLAALRRREAAQLAPDQRASLLRGRRIAWPRLTEPRGLIVQLVAEHGWTVTSATQIPHDLWAAGALPALPLADQLTILLAGFDLTYRIAPSGNTIEIVPVNWQSIAVRKPAARVANSSSRSTTSQQSYSLRIANQPVGRVLEQLAHKLQWQLRIDEAQLRAAGKSLDTRVSFQVENATIDTLLAELLTPAGLRAERHGKQVTIEPR